MTGERVLITTAFLKPDDDVDRLLRAEGFQTVHSPVDPYRTPLELAAELVGVDAVIAGSDAFTREVLAGADRLRVIARTGVGYDGIDVPAATERGIAVCNVPGVNRESVAELAIAFMLMLARHIPANTADVRAGGWARFAGRELGGATLGVVGLGAIGKSVAAIARSFGMRLLAYDPFLDEEYAAEHGIQPASLPEVLAASDFVTLHLLLNESTHHLIDAAALASMKPTASLINTSRGAIIDEAALIDALASGRLAGAGLDVVEHEPLHADSPLRLLDNVILTAHIGGSTAEARARSAIGAAHSVISLLRSGDATTVVNPEFRAYPPAK
jgi:D-3-phosphoglycerate dehydrogenase